MTDADPLFLNVRKTLQYAAVFGAGLRVEQVFQRLQGSRSASKKEVLKALGALPEVAHAEGWWYLRNHRAKCGKPSEEIWKKKLSMASRAAKVIALFPWVSGVWVTGSVAAENADQDDDLDFLVVTRNNRLWLTRLLVVPLLKFCGVYQSKKGANEQLRHQSEEARDKWCLNLWLEECALQVPKPQQSLYTAHEVLLAKPVFLRQTRLQHRFLQENNWIAKFFANISFDSSFRSPAVQEISEEQLSSVDWLNKLAFTLQLRLMNAVKTSEKVGLHAAYFHPRDTKKIVLKRYRSLT